jgi:hypothetical protein
MFSLCPLDGLDKQSPFITSISDRHRELELVKGFIVWMNKLDQDGPSFGMFTLQLQSKQLPWTTSELHFLANGIKVWGNLPRA